MKKENGGKMQTKDNFLDFSSKSHSDGVER